MAAENQYYNGHNPQDFQPNNPDRQFMGDNSQTNPDSQFMKEDFLRNDSTINRNDMQRMMTNGSVSLPPDVFEKLYLSPQNAVKGQLRKTFGNPTPIAVGGFLLALTPLSIELMGWRGAGGGSGNGAAGTGQYFFFAGLLLFVGGILEFFLGNTFPAVVFTTFGGFWLSFGATLTPFFNAMAAYDTTGLAAGATPPAFYASYAFFLLFMGLLTLIYSICALRTNVVFLVIFVTLTFAFPFLAAAYWYAAQGNAHLAHVYTVTGGAFAFITAMAGWWIFLALMFEAVDFPITIPVGDLSTLIKGRSEKLKERGGDHQHEA